MRMTASKHGGNAPTMTRSLEMMVVLALAIGMAVASVAGVGSLPTKAALAATNDNLRAPSEYSITDLGTLPGGLYSEANAINNLGQVAGFSDQSIFFEDSAVLWDDGQMRDLGSLGGWYYVIVTDINDRGQVVAYVGAKTEERPVLWDDGQVTNLGSLGGGSFSRANAINNLGQVVGASYTPSDWDHAFLWQNGNMRDLGTLPGGTYSYANAINNLGQVAGDSATNSGERHAVLWSKQGT